MCVPGPQPLSRSTVSRGGRRQRHGRNLGMQHDPTTTTDICDSKLIIILNEKCSTTTFVHCFPVEYHGICYKTVLSFLLHKGAFRLFKAKYMNI